MTVAEQVREFHEHFGYPVSDRPEVPSDGLRELRRRLVAEEAREVDEALEADDLAWVAHELADLVYVAYGTALTYGIDLDRVIAIVHRANMTKEVGVTGKAFKGPQFVPADVTGALQ